ncbi:hypothetical protein I551_5559 [Mycobacterium ulcerans str. Harvey]|uniref:Uncharacterized protein n=1 Tax=Mycobacterium ulcerans str. Harvey TaxID=1299332 RepID=A0ABP3ADZ2_MYCUL|nr:hypothetical protein I551_5559 [Mycobacterium ulcerans str. Harvey]
MGPAEGGDDRDLPGPDDGEAAHQEEQDRRPKGAEGHDLAA